MKFKWIIFGPLALRTTTSIGENLFSSHVAYPATMTKRACDAIEQVGFPPCGPVPVLRRVLFDPHTACHTVGACQLLELDDLWNLYQTSSGTLRALANHPDIIVYRNARLIEHGDLNAPLCKAFTVYRDHRLMRSFRHYIAMYPKFDPGNRQMSAGRRKLAWRLACGVSLEYAELIWGHFLGSDASLLLEYACWSAPVLLMYAIAQRYDQAWPPRSYTRTSCISLASAGGNVELLKFFEQHPDPLPEPGDEDVYLPDRKGDYIFSSALYSIHDECANYAFTEHADRVIALIKSDLCWQRLPWNLNTLQRMGSVCQKHGVSIDWEHLYVRYMGEQHTDMDSEKILSWLAPLARKQFKGRLSRDKHAKPLFMDPNTRTNFRQYKLSLLGLDEDGRGSIWNRYPANGDARHYMYAQDQRDTGPFAVSLAGHLGPLGPQVVTASRLVRQGAALVLEPMEGRE